VLFNPPYLRTAFGRERDQPQELRTMWDGGADGTETVAAFLDAYAARETNATALLGVNRMHVPRERLRALIAARAALEASELAAHPWLPVDVHVLIRSKSRSASVSTPLA
jgi:methylase of polypeptide subunit release factors